MIATLSVQSGTLSYADNLSLQVLIDPYLRFMAQARSAQTINRRGKQ